GRSLIERSEDTCRLIAGSAMVDPVRQEVIALAQMVVIKIGTNVLAAADGTLAQERVQSLADQVERVRQAGKKVALVSSGAVGAGVGRMALGKRPTDLRHLQACAAVGQSFLMRAYQQALTPPPPHTPP